MHISKLKLINYRNFQNAMLAFNKGINTVIGENGSGKSNLFRAIRLLLDDNLPRSAIRLDERDFSRSLVNWRGHWIIISLEFAEVTHEEAFQSLFLHGNGNIDDGGIERATYNLIFRPKAHIRVALSQLREGDAATRDTILNGVSIGDYETVLTGKSTADFTDSAVYRAIVGDFETVRFPQELDPPEIGVRLPHTVVVAKEIAFTFVQALRDVVSEFHSNRTNPLLALLKERSGDIDVEEMTPITEMVERLNLAIQGLDDVRGVRNDIRSTINDAAGDAYSPRSLSIRSDLSSEPDRLFQSLKLFVGETGDGYEGSIHELSLGGANLIYLTLKLLEFKYQKARQAAANFLLIEEPEAHIHTHIQKTLFDKLNFANTQIIYSTHSTNISEVSNIENVNILGRLDGRCEAFQPSIGLTQNQIGSVQRYLDAVRSNLLFAKSVVLVEGDAEEILLPIMVKKVLGVSLDELGISLINIRSTGFENVAQLFHQERIRKRCSIVTDLDAAFVDVVERPGDAPAIAAAKEKARGSAASGLRRQGALTAFIGDNPWIQAFYAAHTFEVDFIVAGNRQKVISALNEVYVDARTIEQARAQLEANDIASFGPRIITMAKNAGKGWFSIIVGKYIDQKTIIPQYVVDAILFAHGSILPETLGKIIEYRIRHISDLEGSDADRIAEIRGVLTRFINKEIEFPELRVEFLRFAPADEINSILARI